MSDFQQTLSSGWIDIEQRRTGTGVIPFAADDFPADFPLTRWQNQLSKYLHYWRYFTGDVWKETIPNEKDEDGNEILKFPLQINYIKPVVMKHNYVLWGEVPDGQPALAPMKAFPILDEDEEAPSDADKKIARQAENFVNRVWRQNYGRSLQQDAGLVQQVLGGIVFRISEVPDDPEIKNGIRIEYILPDFFMPVWDSGRFNHLLEVWIVYRMPAREANLRFGFDQSKTKGVYDPLYIEHWTDKKITITIDGVPVEYNGTTYKDAPNPYGFVPFVYIPRERAGTYFGLSLIDDLEGMSREMNARWADIGDVIHDTAERDTFVRNISGTVSTKNIGMSKPAIDLGVTPPGTTMEPDAWVVNPPDIPQSLAGYPEDLRKQFIRDSFISGVAEGEDEGSQRSALTLAFRMWPLTSKVRAARNNWSDGLTRIAELVLRMAKIKKLGKINEQHLALDWEVNWSPMVPRDREAELNEIVTAVQNQMLSPETALMLLRIVYDPSEETEKVKKWLEYQMDLQTEAAIAGAAAKGGQTGANAGSKKPIKKYTAGQQDGLTKAVE